MGTPVPGPAAGGGRAERGGNGVEGKHHAPQSKQLGTGTSPARPRDGEKPVGPPALAPPWHCRVPAVLGGSAGCPQPVHRVHSGDKTTQTWWDGDEDGVRDGDGDGVLPPGTPKPARLSALSTARSCINSVFYKSPVPRAAGEAAQEACLPRGYKYRRWSRPVCGRNHGRGGHPLVPQCRASPAATRELGGCSCPAPKKKKNPNPLGRGRSCPKRGRTGTRSPAGGCAARAVAAQGPSVTVQKGSG